MRVVKVTIPFTEVQVMTLLLEVKVSIQFMVVQVMTLSESEKVDINSTMMMSLVFN